MKLSRISIGLAVRTLRDAGGKTLSDLAGRVGMTLSSLSRSENGQRDMSFAEITAIAAELSIDIEYLRTVAETFERAGAGKMASKRDRLANDLNELQRLAVEAAVEARS